MACYLRISSRLQSTHMIHKADIIAIWRMNKVTKYLGTYSTRDVWIKTFRAEMRSHAVLPQIKYIFKFAGTLLIGMMLLLSEPQNQINLSIFKPPVCHQCWNHWVWTRAMASPSSHLHTARVHARTAPALKSLQKPTCMGIYDIRGVCYPQRGENGKNTHVP